MDACFEVDDLVSGNVVDVIERERDAIDALVDFARDHGHEEVGRFALFRERNGESALVAMKDELIRRIAAAANEDKAAK